MILKNKVFVVFGLRGTGKSTFVNHIANSVGVSALVYDTLSESPPSPKYSVYRPHDRYNVGELETVIKMIIPSTTKAPFASLFIIEEANRFCPSKPHVLPPIVADLNDQCRHYNMGLGFVARRPVQLHQDITELADYIVIFRLSGIRDIKYLNDISMGLGDTLKTLKGHDFIIVDPDRSYHVYNAIPANARWLETANRLYQPLHPERRAHRPTDGVRRGGQSIPAGASKALDK